MRRAETDSGVNVALCFTGVFGHLDSSSTGASANLGCPHFLGEPGPSRAQMLRCLLTHNVRCISSCDFQN